MTLLPKVKLKAAVNFPATVLDGTGIDVTKSNGTYRFDLDYGDFAPPVTTLSDPTHQNALMWNNSTGQYSLVSATVLTGSAVFPATAFPLIESGSGAVGSSNKYAREDHVHPISGNTFQQAGAGAVIRTPQDKAREIVSVKDFGAVGDGSTNDAAAFQAAFNACANGGAIFAPAGKYRLNSAITQVLADSKSLTFVGAGDSATTIYFPNGSGFTVEMQGWRSSIHVRDMRITTGHASDSDVGFKVEQAVMLSSDPASEPMSDFTNVSFMSDTGPQSVLDTNYWGYGIVIANKSNFNITMGYYGTSIAGALKGIGIQVQGSVALTSYAVVFNLTGCVFAGFKYGLIYGDYVQGVAVTACNFTGAVFGIYVPTGAVGTLDQLLVTNCQFGNCSNSIFSNAALYNVSLINNYFIITTAASGVFLNVGGIMSRFVGNTFYGGNGIGTNTGIDLTATSQAVITGNVFRALLTGISLRAATSGVNVQSNSYVAVTTPVLNSGTGNRTVNNIGYNPVGASVVTTTATTPYSYTAGASPEDAWFSAASGSITNASLNGGNILAAAVPANTIFTVRLGPNETIAISGYGGNLTHTRFIH